MNEDDDHTWLNVIEESATGELKSDCDEQLILRVEFTQPVKLHSLVIEAGCDAEQAPKVRELLGGANLSNPAFLGNSTLCERNEPDFFR